LYSLKATKKISNVTG